MAGADEQFHARIAARWLSICAGPHRTRRGRHLLLQPILAATLVLLGWTLVM